MPTPDFTSARWVKGSRSEQITNCVEIAKLDGVTGIRDSKLGAASPILTIADASLRALLDVARHG